MSTYHRVFLGSHAATLSLVYACSAPPAPDGVGGTGGTSASIASATSSGSSSARASSSTGVADASADAPRASCAAALHGPDHEAAEGALFAAGSPEAFGAWAAYIACGCLNNPDAGKVGACALDCAGSPWCVGVYPAPGTWADPAGTCATCLEVADATGCGQQRMTCEWY